MKKLINSWWIGGLSGFILGFLVSDDRWGGAFVLGLFGLLFHLQMKFDFGENKPKNQKKESFLSLEEDSLVPIMALAAFVIKADGDVSPAQINVIESKLHRDYKPHEVEKFMRFLKVQINKELNVKKHTRFIREDFPIASKIQLMHFLIGIAIVDTVMADAEMKCLRYIANQIGIIGRTFDGIIAMFKFRYEHQQNQKNTNTSRKKQLIEAAFQVLEIDTSASNEEIKKAYRKMAVLHHPDKVTHLGEEFRIAANEKFKTIVLAYELLQKEKGFV